MDGEVIGCAGVLPGTDDPGRAEHALTTVRRDWRRRGVASALVAMIVLALEVTV